MNNQPLPVVTDFPKTFNCLAKIAAISESPNELFSKALQLCAIINVRTRCHCAQHFRFLPVCLFLSSAFEEPDPGIIIGFLLAKAGFNVGINKRSIPVKKRSQ